jgi:hypothetical protein
MRMKIKKMVIFIFSGLILMGLYSFSECADWKLFYVTESGYKYFYDKESLESPDKNIKKVWQKVAKGLGKDEDQDMFKTHLMINCKTKVYEILSIVEYDGTNEMVISYEDYRNRPPTGDFHLESRIGGLYDNVCP